MARASNVIHLVLLGSALAFIGWSCYRDFQESSDDRGGPRGHHGGFYGLFRGGRGGTSGSSAPSSSGVTARGGFGATGVGAGG